MTEPQWADAIRARTEQLIENLKAQLPENIGPVGIEAALSSVESDYFRDIAQGIVECAADEKKVAESG